jgi:hypothetical protein
VKTAAANGGTACPAVVKKTDGCNTNACPATAVNCEMTEWSKDGGCSKTCGTGEQKMVRSVKTEHANGGTECPPFANGEMNYDQKTEACNTKDCTPKPVEDVGCETDVAYLQTNWYKDLCYSKVSYMIANPFFENYHYFYMYETLL